MEYRVHITMLSTDAVHDSANRVGYAACKKVHKSIKRDGFNSGFGSEYNAPAHTDVAYHREAGVFFQVDGREGHRKRRQPPHKPENKPRPQG